MPVADDVIDALLTKAKNDGIDKLSVGGIVLQNNKLLVVRRALTDTRPGTDEMPSGGVDEDETLHEALYREMREETGMEIADIVAFAFSFDFQNSLKQKTREFFFFVTPKTFDVKLNPAEHSHFFWLAPNSEEFKQARFSKELRFFLEETLA